MLQHGPWDIRLQPSLHDVLKDLQPERFCYEVIHTAVQTSFPVRGHRVSGQGDYWKASWTSCCFVAEELAPFFETSYLANGLIPVDLRHLAIEKHEVVVPRDRTASTAAPPSGTTSTLQPSRVSMVAATSWLTGLSSATRTLAPSIFGPS